MKITLVIILPLDNGHTYYKNGITPWKNQVIAIYWKVWLVKRSQPGKKVWRTPHLRWCFMAWQQRLGTIPKFESALVEASAISHCLLCSYFLDSCTVSDIAEVVNNHESILFEQAGKWVLRIRLNEQDHASAWIFRNPLRVCLRPPRRYIDPECRLGKSSM